MKRDELVDALDSIKPSEEFRQRTINVMLSGKKSKRRNTLVRFAALTAASLLLLTVIFVQLDPFSSSHESLPFEITGVSSGEACYINVVYIDGYAYTGSGWHNENLSSISRGKEIGEVNLDLKGKTYVGVPPNFSGTYDEGTKIYEITGRKPEYAVLAVNDYVQHILYRLNKVPDSEDAPLNTTVAQVISMFTDSSAVAAVDLLDEYNGSWMRTSEDEYLLSLINSELPEQPILSQSELNRDIEYNRIPVNLVFHGGEVLHLQVLPKEELASVFGGYVKLTPALVAAFEDVFNQGSQLPTMVELLPYAVDQVEHLKFKNHIDGNEILPRETRWVREVLYERLMYYRVEEIRPETDEPLFATIELGKSAEDSVSLQFYGASMDNLVFELNGKRYKPARGNIDFKLIEDAFTNY